LLQKKQEKANNFENTDQKSKQTLHVICFCALSTHVLSGHSTPISPRHAGQETTKRLQAAPAPRWPLNQQKKEAQTM
jgi:hypothetical protein